METYIRLEKITNSERIFFTSRDVSIILNVKSVRTRENIIVNLLESKIFTQLEKGKYYLTSTRPSDFEISQFLYSPSYISLESALNQYGILSQFPFEITAVTLKKTLVKKINEKSYVYSKLNRTLFTGYLKKENYLIATPEKALFDYLYMVSKSLRSETYLNEMDFNNVKKDLVLEYLKLTSKSVATQISIYLNKYL